MTKQMNKTHKLPHGLATQVATKAGVSRATVSTVLNEKPGVAQATVLKVLAAAKSVQRQFQRNNDKASALRTALSR